jgi:succinoglycan biosynthesis protein ExoM
MSASPPVESLDTPRICVCLCTCDRQDMLPALFAALAAQTLPGPLTVFVADNGAEPAETVVARLHSDALTPVYRRVADPGVTQARNAAMALAVDAGFDYLAFLDDDELPSPGWLEELMKTALAKRGDIVCGPVEPVFEGAPPTWALAGGFFSKSGETLCSSNLLLRVGVLPHARDDWFYPEFGETGGGDREFLKRLVAGGARTAVALRAVVREHVPAERLALGYMFRRGLRDGMADVQILKRRLPMPRRVWLESMAIAARKLGYALNHLLWSVHRPERMASAVADAGQMCGIVLCLFGRRVRLYGPAVRQERNAG